MKFMPLAAVAAAVTLCAGALADAATPSFQETLPLASSQANNDQPAASVPLQQQPQPAVAQDAAQLADAEPTDTEFASLSEAVAAQPLSEASDEDLRCLATSVYYEAKSEPLAGQLAVAKVILNRTTSGRFPRSVCSVVKQRGQFSFVHSGKLPTPPANAQWRRAVAVAQVAQKDLWQNPVPHALYFHARYVAPSWNRSRVASIGNHVFYR